MPPLGVINEKKPMLLFSPVLFVEEVNLVQMHQFVNDEAKWSFIFTPHVYNNQTWIYNIAVWYQPGRLKKEIISVKCSQLVYKRINKFQYSTT